GAGRDFRGEVPFAKAGDRNLCGRGILIPERGRFAVEPPEPRRDKARVDLLLGARLLVLERAEGLFAFLRLGGRRLLGGRLTQNMNTAEVIAGLLRDGLRLNPLRRWQTRGSVRMHWNAAEIVSKTGNPDVV